MNILSIIIWPLIIIGIIIFFARRKSKHSHPSKNKNWYLQFALSKEDAISQLFLLLSFFFLGVTLLAFNKDFGEPLSWQTILFVSSIIGLVGTYYFKTIYT